MGAGSASDQHPRGAFCAGLACTVGVSGDFLNTGSHTAADGGRVGHVAIWATSLWHRSSVPVGVAYEKAPRRGPGLGAWCHTAGQGAVRFGGSVNPTTPLYAAPLPYRLSLFFQNSGVDPC